MSSDTESESKSKPGYIFRTILLICAVLAVAAGGRMLMNFLENKESGKLAELARSVVQVRTNRARGTGFVIMSGDHLYIATAAHVVSDSSDVYVLRETPLAGSDVFRTIYPDVRVVAVDFERDLAILDVPNLPDGSLVPLPLDPSHCEDASKAYGYPPTDFTRTRELGLTPKQLAGSKRIKLDSEERLGAQSRTLTRQSIEGVVFSPLLDHGNSGGPILSPDGKVVAVTVMKSALRDQGAGVCANHLRDLLASANSGRAYALSGADAAAFITTVVNVFLPFADSNTSSQPVRDFVLPSVLDSAQETYRHFIAASAMPGSSHAQSAFESAFPGVHDSLSSLVPACIRGPQLDDSAIECVVQTAALKMSVALLRQQFKSASSVREVVAQGEPRRVGDAPPEFEVTVLLVMQGKNEALQLRLRYDYGRLWIVPDDPEVALGRSLATIAQSLSKTSRFTGRWVSRLEKTEDGTRMVDNFDILLVNDGPLVKAKSTRTLEGHRDGLLVSSFVCTGTTQYFATDTAEWTGALQGETLVLKRVSGTAGGDWERCQFAPEKTRTVGLTERGELVTLDETNKRVFRRIEK